MTKFVTLKIIKEVVKDSWKK